MLTRDQDKLQGMAVYIDGKMRRYNLLFAVNGGAFAVAKLLRGEGPGVVLGRLQLWHLAARMIAFTVLVAVDIYLFGQMMRTEFIGSHVFGPFGKLILVTLAVLIIVGWALAGFG